MTKKYFKTISTIIIVSSLLLFYQNCGTQFEPIGDLSSSLTRTNTEVEDEVIKEIGSSSSEPIVDPVSEVKGNTLIFMATDMTVSGTMSLVDTSLIQKNRSTDPLTSGLATVEFYIEDAGEYIVNMDVVAPDFVSNSLFVNIDANPTPEMSWHLQPSANIETRSVSWGGDYEGGNKAHRFNLSSGQHTLFIRGREPVYISKIEIMKADELVLTEVELPPVKPRPSGWSMTVKPPKLENPVFIELADNSSTSYISDYENLGCDGRLHAIRIPDGRDAKVVMKKGSGPIIYPVTITGGRNVHIVGLELKPIVQPGCDVGEATNANGKGVNIHPRMPGAKALRVEQSGITFIEGVNIELAGQEADCIVPRNTITAADKAGQYRREKDGTIRSSKETLARFLKNRHLTVVNSRCTGIEGLDKADIGDGVHGDFVQNQGHTDGFGSMVFENISVLSSSNGLTIHSWGSDLNYFKLRNYSHGVDERYYGDDKYDRKNGIAFYAKTKEHEFENLWIDDKRGLFYGYLNDKRVGEGHDQAKKLPGMNKGKPPIEFAPASKTGLNYVSPY